LKVLGNRGSPAFVCDYGAAGADYADQSGGSSRRGDSHPAARRMMDFHIANRSISD